MNEKQTRLLNLLAELLNFGGEQIVKNPIPRKSRIRKALLLGMMSATHNYSEAIFSLLKEARTNGAEVLLRSIFETYLNLWFIYLGRGEKNAATFFLDGLSNKKKIIEDANNYTKKFPDFNTSLTKQTFESLGVRLEEVEKTIKIIKRRYKTYDLKGLPNLRQRTQMIDDYLDKKLKKKPRTRFEWWYLTMYGYFSDISHLGIGGLDTFFDKKEKEIVNLSGDPDAIERIAFATYFYYFEILKQYNKQFKLFERSQLREFKKKYMDILQK